MEDSIVTIQKATNITWHTGTVSRAEREKILQQKGIVIWFTGLSASGKSTLAQAVETKLFEKGYISYVLDGDNVRHGLNKNLGFSPEDREENIRRIGEVAKLFSDCGIIAMTAFISPYRIDRDKVRNQLSTGEFIEIFLNIPIDIAEQRDPKGLYKKARAGEIKDFTGIDAPYEGPENPEIVIDTGKLNVEDSTEIILSYLKKNGIIAIKRFS